MSDDTLRIYFKDLLKPMRIRIRKWFEKHEYVHYTDENGERRHIDEMYNNIIPFFIFYATDDDDIEPETSHADEMVT